MKKMLALFYAIICFSVFTAFDWGKPSSETPKKKPAANLTSQDANSIATAAKVLGSGTPKERQTRMESLRRLSESLARARNPDQTQRQVSAFQLATPPVETHPVTQSSRSETKKRKGLWG